MEMRECKRAHLFVLLLLTFFILADCIECRVLIYLPNPTSCHFVIVNLMPANDDVPHTNVSMLSQSLHMLSFMLCYYFKSGAPFFFSTHKRALSVFSSLDLNQLFNIITD